MQKCLRKSCRLECRHMCRPKSTRCLRSCSLHFLIGLRGSSAGISITQFNLYVSKYPETTELITSHADDFNAAASSAKVEAAAELFVKHAEDVTNRAERRSLQVSVQNSTFTLFTFKNQQRHHHPRVSVNVSPVPLYRTPTFLGVTLDPHLFFHHPVYEMVKIAKPWLNLLRLLCGTNWDHQK